MRFFCGFAAALLRCRWTDLGELRVKVQAVSALSISPMPTGALMDESFPHTNNGGVRRVSVSLSI
jgi:hypothetical protein